MTVIERILGEAEEKGASDVHLAVGAFPFMRIGGKLQSFGYGKLSNDDTLDFVLKYMTEAQREVFEERGEYAFSLSVVGARRCRVNAYKQLSGVALAFRFQKQEEELTESALDMPRAVWKLGEKERGLVLVTGPAGSGKTTTLAALIKQINENRAVHVITLEHPIEYVHSNQNSLISQREVGVDCADYAEAINGALKEDADVILASELRDTSATAAALAAAEAGALVFAEMNAGSAVGALEQLIEQFELNKQKRIRERLMNILEAIVFQQQVQDEEGALRVVYKVVESKKPTA